MPRDLFDKLQQEEEQESDHKIEVSQRRPVPLKPMPLCQSFRQLAFHTWSKLYAARHVEYQPHEIGITDELVIALKQRHPSQIFLKTFTNREEGITGADWEWWFIGTNQTGIGFRVQAKVINLEDENYPHLHYPTDRTKTPQCDRLIRSALTGTSVPTLPMYCLYSNWARFDPTDALPSVDHRAAQWPCHSYAYASESYGCSVSSAFAVRSLRLRGRQDDLGHVFSALYPWHCLVCCSGYDGSDLPTRVRSFWRHAVQNQEPDDSSHPDPDDPAPFDPDFADLQALAMEVSVTNQLPQYVENMLLGVPTEPPDPTIAGILVLRENT